MAEYAAEAKGCEVEGCGMTAEQATLRLIQKIRQIRLARERDRRILRACSQAVKKRRKGLIDRP